MFISQDTCLWGNWKCSANFLMLFWLFYLTIPDSDDSCVPFRYCDFGISLVANRCLYQTDTLCQCWDDSSKQQQRLATKSSLQNGFFTNQSYFWFWSFNGLDANLWHLRHRCVPSKNRWCPPWRNDVVGLLPSLYKDLEVDEDGTALKFVALMKCLLRGYSTIISILNCKNPILKGSYNLFKGALDLIFCFFLGGVERQQGLLYVCGGRDEQREPLSSVDLRVQWGSVAKAHYSIQFTCVFCRFMPAVGVWL